MLRPRSRERGDLLPELLGDERDDRVGEAQRRLEHANQRAAGATLLRFAGGNLDLGDFQVPVAILVPHELVHRARRRVEAVLGERLGHGALGTLQPGDDPAVRRGEFHRSFSSSPVSWPSQFMSTKRVAFQSLLQKLR
jgi:hypothetical protein